MPLTPRITSTGPQEWVNSHGNVTAHVAQLFDLRNPLISGNQSTLEAYNAMTAAMQELVARAQAANVRLRAAGAGWSLSEAPVTEGWMLNTQPLDLTFRLDPQMVVDNTPDHVASLRFVQCGIGVAQLSALLRQDGLSLKTSGASNGQTLAGAISTGTHGAALEVGAMQDYVCGIHLIPDARRSVWLERASRPVTTAAFAAALGAELRRDDGLFEAALVSFGSFGIIHGLLIETEPVYLLEAYRRRLRLTEPLWQAISELNFNVPQLPHPGERPYHWQVVFNPHDVAGGVYVTIMYKRPYRPDYTPPPLPPEGFRPGDDAPAFVGLLTDAVPAAIPRLTQAILDSAYAPYERQEGTLAELFSNTEPPRPPGLDGPQRQPRPQPRGRRNHAGGAAAERSRCRCAVPAVCAGIQRHARLHAFLPYYLRDRDRRCPVVPDHGVLRPPLEPFRAPGPAVHVPLGQTAQPGRHARPAPVWPACRAVAGGATALTRRGGAASVLQRPPGASRPGWISGSCGAAVVLHSRPEGPDTFS